MWGDQNYTVCFIYHQTCCKKQDQRVLGIPTRDTYITSDLFIASDTGDNQIFEDLAPVVRKVDNAIHWINFYPLGIAIGVSNIYPRDSAWFIH